MANPDCKPTSSLQKESLKHSSRETNVTSLLYTSVHQTSRVAVANSLKSQLGTAHAHAKDFNCKEVQGGKCCTQKNATESCSRWARR